MKGLRFRVQGLRVVGFRTICEPLQICTPEGPDILEHSCSGAADLGLNWSPSAQTSWFVVNLPKAEISGTWELGGAWRFYARTPQGPFNRALIWSLIVGI